jgi:hypothetical protein
VSSTRTGHRSRVKPRCPISTPKSREISFSGWLDQQTNRRDLAFVPWAVHQGRFPVFDTENVSPLPSLLNTPSKSPLSYTFSVSTPLLNSATTHIDGSRPWTLSPSLHAKRKRTAHPFSDSLPTALNTEAPPAKRVKRTYRPRKSVPDKLVAIFTALQEVDWTLGDFLYFTFQTKDNDGKDLKRSTQHAMYATNFLQGRTSYTPSMILELWFHSPDGRAPVEMSHDVPMYSLEHVYTSIKPARTALTVWLCGTDCPKEAYLGGSESCSTHKWPPCHI